MVTKSAIVAYYKETWRQKAATNTKLQFLNVQVTGLTGRPHPVLSGILTTQEVTRSRVPVKMLAGDYPCMHTRVVAEDKMHPVPFARKLILINQQQWQTWYFFSHGAGELQTQGQD